MDARHAIWGRSNARMIARSCLHTSIAMPILAFLVMRAGSPLPGTTQVTPLFDGLIVAPVVGSDQVKKPVVVEVGNPNIVGTIAIPDKWTVLTTNHHVSQSISIQVAHD